MTNKLIQKIKDSTVYDVVKKTPLHKLNNISKEFNNAIYLKREDLQPTHSFKIRGAYNKISQLPKQTLQHGIIAASAGNHAQGVAYSAMKLGIKATIVMPKTTPEIKVDSVKNFKANVVLHGDSYDDAYKKAQELLTKENAIFIHPYDDDDVIAGQGTIAIELLNQLDSIDIIVIPVGGGGLLAGITTYIKAIKPSIRIIAVEPENSNCFEQAINKNKRVTLKSVGIFADGVAVKQIGKRPFELTKDIIDETILVSTDEICAAIKEMYDDLRAIAEPSGGLSLAGIKKLINKENLTNKNCVGILCGANINFHRLRHISERAEIGEQKEALLSVTIPEEKGSFLTFCNELAPRTITEFNYRYNNNNQANIFVGLQCNDIEELIQTLKEKGYNIINLSQNELAKLHIRYMVGGKSIDIKNERLFRFQFPERPNALLDFLTTLGGSFNISLFHYRNHGAAFGRVLAGIQVKKKDIHIFNKLINKIGYTYFDETNNPAYQAFL